MCWFERPLLLEMKIQMSGEIGMTQSAKPERLL
jgi:hypothetical protein